MKKKLLYIDVPFSGVHGGDKNRSNFLWNILKENYDTDLMLIKRHNIENEVINDHQCQGKTFYINTCRQEGSKSEAIYNFNKVEIEQFGIILRSNNYDIIFVRFLSPSMLALVASDILPEVKIVIDVDMLFSRIAQMNWDTKHSIRNKYFYFEKTKLIKFENEIFQNDFTFLFTNNFERDSVLKRNNIEHKINNFKIIPNMMKNIELDSVASNDEDYILFFGTLNSVANNDALEVLAEQIYPVIRYVLSEKKLKILVVGKNPLPQHYDYDDEYFKIIGPVDDINAYIKGAKMVLLPIRIASGTRTRILEAGALKRPVLTTDIGAEGFDFNHTEIVVEDDIERLIPKIIYYLKKEDELEELGQNLYKKCLESYDEKVVSHNLIEYTSEETKREIRDKLGGKMKITTGKRIAIVTNRFYPEVGGAETNIYYQARMLAEDNDVTVICPKRIDKPQVEIIDGITVYRLKDTYNRKKLYPNKKAKTFCPDLFGMIMFGHYDVVQVFPALNPNNMLAFFAAKLSKTPIVLASFDYLDYASIIKKEGSINPDILRFHRPKAKQRFFLKRFDYIFAISNKEIDFYKKYNENVEYSPVPILLEEYKGQKINPKAKYDIKDSEFVYLVLGRICNVKGQDIALRAFKQVASEIPNSKLVFVGRFDYEPEFYDEMQKFIRKNNLMDRVIFTGMIERDEVLGWLRYSDIHVIPVRFMNSGAVVVESWISDTPVIQSDVVDPNLVVDGKNGYIFPREDSKTCASKMIKAYKEKDKLAELAQTGKELVEKKYTYRYLTDLYLRVYDKISK